METVLVTGAAGTVGNYVVGLAEAAGFRVIATDLVPQGVQQPVRGEVRGGDLRDPAFLERVTRGVDHVIHTAAMLDVGTPEETLRAVNTQAVGALYDVAARSGAKRFIQVSTSMIYGQGDLIRETLRLVVGQAPDVAPRHRRHASIRFLFAPAAGRLDGFEGIEEARAVESVVEVARYRSPGDALTIEGDFRDRIGHVVACADGAAAAAGAAERARDAVRVVVGAAAPAADRDAPLAGAGEVAA